MHLDIDERHLLRLGHGEEMLETEKDFSRYGRVNYVLQQRLALLKEVCIYYLKSTQFSVANSYPTKNIEFLKVLQESSLNEIR